MSQDVEYVIIGVDPHKLSATIEVVDHHEQLLGFGRFTTDQAGYTAKASDRRSTEQFSIKERFDRWGWCGKDRHEWFSAPPGEHLYSFRCPQCGEERHALAEHRYLDIAELARARRPCTAQRVRRRPR